MGCLDISDDMLAVGDVVWDYNVYIRLDVSDSVKSKLNSEFTDTILNYPLEPDILNKILERVSDNWPGLIFNKFKYRYDNHTDWYHIFLRTKIETTLFSGARGYYGFIEISFKTSHTELFDFIIQGIDNGNTGL